MFGLSFTLNGVSIWGQGGAGVAPPPAANDDGWFFDDEDASAHLLTCGVI
jgi:hypothetical protein